MTGGARRLVRYAHDGSTYEGVVEAGRVHPVRLVPPPPLPLDGDRHDPDAPSLPLDAVSLLAPVSPGTVFGMARNTGPGDRALPPQAFLKAAASVTGPGDPIVVPVGSESVVAEAELAVVIGQPARGLTVGDALGVVAGYTVGLDVTAADRKQSDPLWTEAKSRESFTPLGPWLISAVDPADLGIELAVDGEVVATGRTSGLARGVAECVAYLSSLVTLRPGDVVLTGAPNTSAPVRPGSQVAATVESVGTLVNPVVAERTAHRAAPAVRGPSVPGLRPGVRAGHREGAA